MTGRGTMTWPNGDRYDGQFMDGIRQGRGVMVYADGGRYEGEWRDNLANGHRGMQFGGDAFQKTPLGQATREAIAKAVSFIVSEMDRVPWTGRVVQVKGDEIIVNAGANMNLKPGVALDAYARGEDLIDPATGVSLGSRDALVGSVILKHVDERFSIGTFAGQGALKRGDTLRLK